jgi:hypothetical protein
MNIDEAAQVITKIINTPDPYYPDKMVNVLLNELTIERYWGWVFFYNSQLYLDTGNISDALAGNSPYIVNRSTDEVIETGTAHPIDHYIEKYEQNLKQSE